MKNKAPFSIFKNGASPNHYSISKSHLLYPDPFRLTALLAHLQHIKSGCQIHDLQLVPGLYMLPVHHFAAVQLQNADRGVEHRVVDRNVIGCRVRAHGERELFVLGQAYGEWRRDADDRLLAGRTVVRGDQDALVVCDGDVAKATELSLQ